MKLNVFRLSHRIKHLIEASCNNNIQTGENVFLEMQLLKFSESLLVVNFGLYESSLHFQISEDEIDTVYEV